MQHYLRASLSKNCIPFHLVFLGHVLRFYKPSKCQGRPPSAAFARGFTLIEMLAALSIFALVIGILSSAVSQALRLAETGQQTTARAQDAILPVAWFRETVSQSVIDATLAEKSFAGNAQGFSGTSLRSLDTALSGPGRYRWTVDLDLAESKTLLRYQAGDREARVVHSWPGSVGMFRYLDHHGGWHDAWPPTGIAEQLELKRRPLPMIVALQTGGDLQIVAAIQDHSPPPRTMKELIQ